MKFHYFLAFLSFLCLTLKVSAQAPNLLWAKQFGGTGSDRGNSVFVDNSGNVYTTGYFTGTVDFDPGPGSFNLSAAAGYTNVYVSKLDASGNFIWAKGWGAGAGNSIAVDANGNVYTTGRFGGTADFDPGPGVYNLTSVNAPNNQAFISKLDPSGNFIWARQCGGHSASSIAVGPNGNVAITGGFSGKFDFDPGPAVFNLTSATNMEDICVTSLDASGNFLLAKRMGGASLDYAYSIAIDAQGNIYTTGLFQSTVDFDPGPGIFNLTQPSTSLTEIFVSKLDASGNFVWAKNWGSPDNSMADSGNSIVLDATGNIYTTGIFNSTADFDPGTGTYNLTSIGNTDVFVSKLDPSGNFLWAARHGGANLDQGLGIALDTSENVYVSGQSPSGKGIALKFDASGNFVWEAPMGKIGNDIAVDAQQNIYITGYFTGTIDFDPGDGILNLTDFGVDDIFMVKLCHLEPPVISGPSSFCQGSSVLLTSSTAGSYLWSNGDTTETITVNAAGDYKVTISNAAGCTAISAPTTISVNPLPSVNAIASFSSICIGSAVTLTGSGASTYIWSNGVLDGIPFNPTVTATYTVTGTAANTGCQNTATKTITVNPLPNVGANASVMSVCVGSNTPVTLSGTGASTYTWLDGVLNGTPFVPSATTTYTVTGTDTNTGCQNTATKTIIVNPLPGVNAIASVSSVCIGSLVTLTGSGASTYTWSNGVLNGVPFNPTVTATYTVTGTDTNTGCQNTATKTITVNPLPSVNAIASVSSVCIGSPVTLTGSGASTYTWSNGVLNGIPFVPTATATYTVTGTDTNTGCQNTATKTIAVNALPTVGANASQMTVCSGTTVTLSGSGASSYAWSNGVLNGVPFVPTATTTYTVTGTVANTGCQNTATQTITVNPLPTVGANASQTTVCSGTTVTLSGSGASSYTWSNGVLNGVPFVPTTTTTYTVTGTVANTGCQNTATQTITVNPLPNVLANASQTTVCRGGSVTLSGSGANSFTWSNGIENGVPFTPTATATYTVTGIDGNACSNTASITITVHPLPTVNLGPDLNLPTGPAILDATGPGLTYLWSNGAITPTISVTSSGTYSVTVTNTLNCTATDEVAVHFTVSSSDLDNESSVVIFPNPVQGILSILCEGSATTSAQVIDNLGRIVLDDNNVVADGAIRILNLENMPPGAYFIRLTGKGFTRTSSIIKQ
ncbi:MAG: SBBP repeat-containing protein [Saprospiraceae bacterium]